MIQFYTPFTYVFKMEGNDSGTTIWPFDFDILFFIKNFEKTIKNTTNLLRKHQMFAVRELEAD